MEKWYHCSEAHDFYICVFEHIIKAAKQGQGTLQFHMLIHPFNDAWLVFSTQYCLVHTKQSNIIYSK